MVGSAAMSLVLEQEAQSILPNLTEYERLYNNGSIKSCELVGSFILLYLGTRHKNAWSNGKLSSTIVARDELCRARLSRNNHWVPITTMPGLIEILGEKYLRKKFGLCSDISLESKSILDVFNTLRLSGIKHNGSNYVNQCIVGWALEMKPCKLLHHIPSPMEVLRMQANGERVVTMFCTLTELSKQHISKLTYMKGMINHARDPLEFLLHDFKHMEHFTCCDTHHEQIGFFRCMMRLGEGNPKQFFLRELGYDRTLWLELEYVISDMYVSTAPC